MVWETENECVHWIDDRLQMIATTPFLAFCAWHRSQSNEWVLAVQQNSAYNILYAGSRSCRLWSNCMHLFTCRAEIFTVCTLSHASSHRQPSHTLTHTDDPMNTEQTDLLWHLVNALCTIHPSNDIMRQHFCLSFIVFYFTIFISVFSCGHVHLRHSCDRLFSSFPLSIKYHLHTYAYVCRKMRNISSVICSCCEFFFYLLWLLLLLLQIAGPMCVCTYLKTCLSTSHSSVYTFVAVVACHHRSKHSNGIRFSFFCSDFCFFLLHNCWCELFQHQQQRTGEEANDQTTTTTATKKNQQWHAKYLFTVDRAKMKSSLCYVMWCDVSWAA